jgi:type IV pilus assembly protein PilM
LARTTIGLDIGTSAVRAAEVRGKDTPTLARFAQVALPAGAIVNGEIADPDAVASVLRDLWRRGEFRSKQVAVAVANQNVVVRQIDVPKMDEDELRGALRFQVADVIPIPIDDTLLDHLVLEEFDGPDGEMLRLLVVAAHKDMVGSLMHAVRHAGLEPVAVDLSPLAAVRTFAFSPSPLTEAPGEAVLDVGAGVTTIVVHERGTPRFVRILSGGGDDITSALVNALAMSVEDAEAAKVTLGVAPAGTAPEPGAAQIIEQRATAFIDDVRRSLDYYASQPDSIPVARLVVTGGGAQLPGLLARMASSIELPVEPGRVLDHVKAGDLGLSEEQLEHVSAVSAVAVGLALEER